MTVHQTSVVDSNHTHPSLGLTVVNDQTESNRRLPSVHRALYRVNKGTRTPDLSDHNRAL